MTDLDGKKYPECKPSFLCVWCDYDDSCGENMKKLGIPRCKECGSIAITKSLHIYPKRICLDCGRVLTRDEWDFPVVSKENVHKVAKGGYLEDE